MEELEGKLAASARHSEHLSAAISKEQQKVRFFFGHDLQQLSRENLEQLEAFHQSSLAKIQSRLVSHFLQSGVATCSALMSGKEGTAPFCSMPLSPALGNDWVPLTRAALSKF